MDGYEADGEIVPYDGGGGETKETKTQQAVVAEVDPLGEEERRKTMNERIAKIQRERNAKAAAEAEKAVAARLALWDPVIAYAARPGSAELWVSSANTAHISPLRRRGSCSLCDRCVDRTPRARCS